MRRNFTAIILLLIISQEASAQLTNYKLGDKSLRSTIDINLVKFHNEELILSGVKAILFGIIKISKNGKISSVSALNPIDNNLTKAFSDAVIKTKGNWLNGNSDYTTILPIYLINENDSGQVTMQYANLVPFEKDIFPLTTIILEPIVLDIQWVRK